MMGFLNFFSTSPRRKFLAALAAGALLGAAAVAFFLRDGGDAETLVVRTGIFVQEVSVSGKVVAAQDVELGFPQSGRISRVYARVGQAVAAGAVLAEAENGDLRAALLQRQAELESARAELSKIESGKREFDALMQAREAVANAARDAYIVADEAVHTAVDQFMSNSRTANPQLNFISARTQQVTDFLAERLEIEALLIGWQKSPQPEHLSENQDGVLKAQSGLAEVSVFLASAAALLSEATPSTMLPRATLDGYLGDVAAARNALGAAASALTAAVTAEKAARADADAAPSAAAQKAAQVKAAEANLQSAEAQLEKSLIRAPFGGVVVTIDAKAGKIVSPNTPEITLQSAGAFRIESFVPEIHVALLKAGNPAVVTLDAYGDEPFRAAVVAIDPAETVRDGVSTYRTLLEFNAQDPRIKSGMTANIIVTTEKKDGVIAVPQGIVAARDGIKYVFVLEGGALVEREVTLGGVSSRGDVEILSGLRDGDIVVLPET